MVDKKMEGGQTNKLKFNVSGMDMKKQKSYGAPSSPNKKFKKETGSGKHYNGALNQIFIPLHG